MTFEQLQKANETIKTTDIKGKDYAEVNQRIKVFRMLFPEGFIRTQILNLENGIVTMYAEVGNGETVLGTGTAQEKESSSYINKTSYIENCETSAVGRALGMLGIGIDTSVASYEEVQNAINNQEQKTTAPDKRSKVQVDALIMLASRKGVTCDKLLKKYKVKNLADLPEKEYIACLKGLEQMPDSTEAVI
jgi:hypothetical protein